jgi:hypothetical protein
VTSTPDPNLLNRRELERYLGRLGDRWPLQRALLGGARVADACGAPAQRERGAEYVVVIVSEAFAGVPWLERVYQAANLWDSSEMGAPADVHCYTPPELARKVERMRRVRDTVSNGIDLLAPGA